MASFRLGGGKTLEVSVVEWAPRLAGRNDPNRVESLAATPSPTGDRRGDIQ